ncbi:MAG: hypothetical protein K2J78_02825 [Muribaculaceae bacterium]|nr:hypothetical protein [Muribaculaceae bacterium]
MQSKNRNIISRNKWLTAFMAVMALLFFTGEPANAQTAGFQLEPVKKVLFIGDSMTGWMAERLNAYGDENDFEVATIVWDGSTLSKWAETPNLQEIIEEQTPDAIIVSLGMNEMFESNPERFKGELDTIVSAFGQTPFLWIGPPSWPGHSEGQVFNDWLAENLGEGNYFSSLNLDLPRQSKSNPHPTRQGIEEWIDQVVEWMPENSHINLPAVNLPEDGKMTRGETFIYKRMNEKL